MPKSLVILISLLLICPFYGWTQQKNLPGASLPISKAKGSIQLDGVLDEEDWKHAAVAKNFFMNFPYDSALAPFQTEARLTFDDQNLYVSFICYDDQTPDIVQSLRRDFDFDNNDNVSVILGPYNDKINGFFFIITPRGVQMEGTIATGGAGDDSFNETWDNKWYSFVQKYEDRWVAEMAIPFKSIRHKSGLSEWNITFMRWDRKRNLGSSWIATPIQFIPASFAYSGQLQWQEPPPESKSNISLIPFVAAGTSRDNTSDPVQRNHDLQAGFDAKIGITPSLNLDLTFNPDFSQVEVDRQVINLTRFEFQFPELRQFFLENNDLFQNAGFPQIRPFFSRRIGLARDSSGNIQRIPIFYGARLSGSITKDWRMSVLNMHTRENLETGLPDQNYTVAALQRNFWKQSNITLSYVNKESLGITENDSLKYFNSELWKNKIEGTDTLALLNRYNRVLTLDLDLLSADNKWYGSFFYSTSFDAFNTSDKQSAGAFVRYNKRSIEAVGGGTFLQRNYNAEAGFVPAIGIYPGLFETFFNVAGRLFPKHKAIAIMGPSASVNFTHIPSGTLTDKSFNLGYYINFNNTANLEFNYGYTFQQLTFDFNPISRERYSSFLNGEKYHWHNYNISYQSDLRKVFNFILNTNAGGFYNGDSYGLSGRLNYRYQPYGSVSVQFDYNDIRLPDNYGKERLLLLGPRADLTLTDKLFLTTFVQYNQLADNINLNARFQWRYQPASDFFVVYTENYLPAPFSSKNRALVMKFTYWLNI